MVIGDGNSQIRLYLILIFVFFTNILWKKSINNF